MQSRLAGLISAIIMVMAASMPSVAQEISDEFFKTYRAYDQAFRRGDMERAAELAQKTLRLAVDELGDEHEKIPVLLINLGHAKLLTGNLDEAEKYLTEAEDLINKMKDPPEAHSNLITIHEDLAQVHIGREELDKARAELDTVIDLRTEENGADDPLIADILSIKARLAIAEQEYESAESLLQRGREILENNYGKDSNQVAGFLSLLGDLALARGQLDKAEKLYLQAMESLKKNLLADDPNILSIHRKLANLYINMDSDKFMHHADSYIAEADLEEGSALPYFVIKPDKPAKANSDTGWVLLEMTITEDGRVKDPRVIESNPKGVLDEVTLTSARKWRFKPKIKDGERLSQPNTRARVVFQGDRVEVHLGEMAQPG